MPGTKANFPDRDTIAAKLNALSETDRNWLSLLLENPAQDDVLLEGLTHFLNQAAEARFLNALKLTRAGEWLGGAAPSRLQVRLTETAKSSQHAAFAAFREGLAKSGGLERAYPKSRV